MALAGVAEGYYRAATSSSTGRTVRTTYVVVGPIVKPAYRLEILTGRRVYIAGDRIRVDVERVVLRRDPGPGRPAPDRWLCRADGHAPMPPGHAIHRTTAVAATEPGGPEIRVGRGLAGPSRGRRDQRGQPRIRRLPEQPDDRRRGHRSTDGRVKVTGDVHLVDVERLEAAIADGVVHLGSRPARRAGPRRHRDDPVHRTDPGPHPDRHRVRLHREAGRPRSTRRGSTSGSSMTSRSRRPPTARSSPPSPPRSADHDYRVVASVGDPDGHRARTTTWASRHPWEAWDTERALLCRPSRSSGDGDLRDRRPGRRHPDRSRPSPQTSARRDPLPVLRGAARHPLRHTSRRRAATSRRSTGLDGPEPGDRGRPVHRPRLCQRRASMPRFRSDDRRAVGRPDGRRDPLRAGRHRDGRRPDARRRPATASPRAWSCARSTRSCSRWARPARTIRWTSCTRSVASGVTGELCLASGADRRHRWVATRRAVAATSATTSATSSCSGWSRRTRTAAPPCRSRSRTTSPRGASPHRRSRRTCRRATDPSSCPSACRSSSMPRWPPSTSSRTGHRSRSGSSASAMQAGDPATIRVTSETLGLRQRAAGRRGVRHHPRPAAATDRRHAHASRSRATSGTGAAARTDRLTRTFTVVPTRLTTTQTAYVELPGGASAIEGGDGLTRVRDLGRDGRPLSRAPRRSSPPAAAPASIAGSRPTSPPTCWSASFGMPPDVGPAEPVVAARYQRDGGLSLMPYSSSDLWLSEPRGADGAEPRRRQRSSTAYLAQVRSDPTETRERRTIALAGLAGLGEPVLPEIRAAAADTSLTIRERLHDRPRGRPPGRRRDGPSRSRRRSGTSPANRPDRWRDCGSGRRPPTSPRRRR